MGEAGGMWSAAFPGLTRGLRKGGMLGSQEGLRVEAIPPSDNPSEQLRTTRQVTPEQYLKLVPKTSAHGLP